MKIESVWKELEADESILYSGLLYKRFSGEIKPDVYVALKAPEKMRCIAARINNFTNSEVEPLNSLRDIKIETIPDQEHPGKKFLLILLLDNQFKDIFATLCEDLMNNVAEIGDENMLISELLARLFKWQAIFEQYKLPGLSEESQMGLFGELFFMRKFLHNSDDFAFCLNAWKGPENAVQDFQHSNWAIEVKATHGKNHQKIQITSERQLDTDIVTNIYLYHLSLDIRENKGETLNDIVDDVKDILKDNSVAFTAFKLKLLSAGYFENHRVYYTDTGYNIRLERIFFVTGSFPRITERQIAAGVGDVRYSIIIGDDVSWKISEEELFSQARKKSA